MYGLLWKEERSLAFSSQALSCTHISTGVSPSRRNVVQTQAEGPFAGDSSRKLCSGAGSLCPRAGRLLTKMGRLTLSGNWYPTPTQAEADQPWGLASGDSLQPCGPGRAPGLGHLIKAQNLAFPLYGGLAFSVIASSEFSSRCFSEHRSVAVRLLGVSKQRFYGLWAWGVLVNQSRCLYYRTAWTLWKETAHRGSIDYCRLDH